MANDTPITAATPVALTSNVLIPAAIVGNPNALNVSGQAIVNAVLAAITPAFIGSLNFSTLPTSDPGGGKVWLNGGVGSGVLQVGS